MSFGTMSTPAPQVAVNYFVAINELTVHDTSSTNQETTQQASSPFTPFLPYTPFIIAGLLFVVAFGILIINRAKSLKNMTTALVLAVMIASIPMVLTYINQGMRQTAKAGPDEIPRELRVTQGSPTFAVITWHTDAKHTGVIRFGLAPLSDATARVYVADDRKPLTDHSISIGGLKKGTSYEFEILSGTTWYDNNGAPIHFTH